MGTEWEQQPHYFLFYFTLCSTLSWTTPHWQFSVNYLLLAVDYLLCHSWVWNGEVTTPPKVPHRTDINCAINVVKHVSHHEHFCLVAVS